MYCSCEAVSQGDLGVIEDSEFVVRVVCQPRHISKIDGSIKPGVFPPTHIEKRGLSLMRSNYLTTDELRGHANAVAAYDTKQNAVGVIDCQACDIRSLKEDDGTRSVCLFDNPVVDDPTCCDNPAHALLIVARQMEDRDIIRIRFSLLQAFSKLRRFDVL